MRLAKTYGYLKKDLDLIEVALNQSVQAEHAVLRKATLQLLEAGGKRIRPVFVLLSGQIGNYDMERLQIVAVSLELIHMATLVHDDVVDDAALRRGKPTVKSVYDNRIAMYTGDFMLARALENITTLKDPKIHQILSKTLVDVCVGEIEQIEFKFKFDQQLRDYLRRIKRKTALLIATSCKLGALAGGVSEKDANRLYRYGYYVGMSYQIIDDILDFTSTEKELGKPAASDLLQGNITLPVLYGMQDPRFNTLLKEVFSNQQTVTKENVDELLSVLKKTNAIERSYQMSERYLTKALHALEELPDRKAKNILQDIARTIGKRRS